MKLRVHLSGMTLFETDVDCSPTIGALVRIETENYKKGLWPGTILEFRVTADQPPEFDFTEHPPVVILDANGYEVIREGVQTD